MRVIYWRSCGHICLDQTLQSLIVSLLLHSHLHPLLHWHLHCLLLLPHYLLHSHQDCDQKLAPPFPSLSARMRAHSTNLTAYLCRIVSARNVRNSPKIAHFVIVCSRTKVDSVCFIFCFNLSCFQCCGSSELSVSEFSLHSPVFAYIDCIMCGSCILWGHVNLIKIKRSQQSDSRWWRWGFNVFWW